VMWEEVGVMRTEAGMKRGLSGIAQVSDALMDVGVAADNLAFNLTWHDWLNLRSLCDVSEVITKAGIARENSRGAHFREDFPEPGAMADSDFTVASMEGDAVTVTREPVAFTIVKPGETILPEGAPETLVARACCNRRHKGRGRTVSNPGSALILRLPRSGPPHTLAQIGAVR